MANILFLTTDLPFFPGKHGIDFFNIRHLARRHTIGVVGPRYPFLPATGVRKLEDTVRDTYFWPYPPLPVTLPDLEAATDQPAAWMHGIPAIVRKTLLKASLGLLLEPPFAFQQLAVLSNCAPQLLRALHDRHWDVVVLLQSNTEPWLRYLPSSMAKVVCFHDIRSDYLRRDPHPRLPRLLHLVTVWLTSRQERRACASADSAIFVSRLDHERAEHSLKPRCLTGVAPIPIDTDYYHPAPAHHSKPACPVVLFTGHLSHPPNVDAVAHFVESVWPAILAQCPDALFNVVGCLPDPGIETVCRHAKNVSLYANVPDIRPYFWDASVFVVPMRFGGGVRQKILESWAMRVPTVCSSMSLEGLDARDGEHCWIANTPPHFAKTVVGLLDGSAPASVLDHAAAYVREYHAVPKASAHFESEIRRAMHAHHRRPYRLLIDLRWMAIGTAGGVEQMCHELVSAISKWDHHNEYRLLCPRSTYYEWTFPPQFKCKGYFIGRAERAAEARHAGVINQLAASLQRPQVMTPEMRSLNWYRRLDFDMVHSPCSYAFPDLACFPTVLTMHDLQHVHFPQFFSRSEREEREHLYRTSCEKAEHIVCISDFTRQDLHDSYGVPLERMTTIWNIPSQRVWDPLPAELNDTLLADMGVARPFLLFPAHGWPHKNHHRLIEAFSRIQDELPPDLKLVMTGRPLDARHPVNESIHSRRLGERIKHIGYRSPLEMQALLSNAHALVFPSLFEGFGMPVAEAIIAECPVACSNTTSLPEIAGPAALTFDPMDVDEIAGAMLTIATNGQVRESLKAECRQRKHLFSQRDVAFGVLDIYQRVFDNLANGWPS